MSDNTKLDKIDPLVLAHYWGEPWVSRGEYPKEGVSQEQKEELAELNQLFLKARRDELKSLAIMWGALPDPEQSVLKRIAELDNQIKEDS